MSMPQRVRCAIYTRKSSEEGLEQAFNSLDAQREACAAYILSQASEGWTALPDIYDDGGLSGGTLERPALQRLLSEVIAGRVDTIVVYKVDRLTRSLIDFSRLVEMFDKAGTSFVSVTQSFNTTTSMGRLTLNMLLSFAQFEREVTAERIRDKIAASKAKGMWMGGTPPLGYAPDGRSLKIVDEHAAVIRDIYARYLDLRNVRLVELALAADGIGAPVRTMTTTGRVFGGVPFGRGQLYKILTCPTYVGEIHHKDQIYTALHKPIIERDTWDAVQAQLAANRQGERSKVRAASPSLLAGLIVDAVGEPLIATHANKPVRSGTEGGKVRYRYYVSKSLHHSDSQDGMRIPAREIESAVTKRVSELFEDPLSLISSAWLKVAPSDIASLANRCTALATAKLTPVILTSVISRVKIQDGRVEIDCDTKGIASILAVEREVDAPPTITVISEVRLTRSGRAMRLVHANGAAVDMKDEGSTIRLLIKARGWWAKLRTGEIDIKTLALQEGVNASWMTRVVRLAFLAPAIIEATLAGAVRADVDAAALTETGGVAACWTVQARTLLPAGRS